MNHIARRDQGVDVECCQQGLIDIEIPAQDDLPEELLV